MKRLTKRLDCGRVAIFSAEDGEEYIPQAVIFRDAVDRLAAYEDKGVEPEDMLSAVEMAKAVCKLTVADAYIATGLMPERVAELAQAERAGRLVVLPDGDDTAALAATIESTDMIRVWCGGDGDLLIGLLSMLAREVAQRAGTSYGTLLMFMAAHRPIVDMSRENRTEEGKSDERG